MSNAGRTASADIRSRGGRRGGCGGEVVRSGPARLGQPAPWGDDRPVCRHRQQGNSNDELLTVTRVAPLSRSGVHRRPTRLGGVTVQTSVAVTQFAWSGDRQITTTLVEVVRLCDARGIDSVFLSDHLGQGIEPGTDPADPMLEAFTALGFLAAHTQRVRLGVLVAAVTLRPPALLVKAVTSLDVLSGGRAWFGVGAGYQLQEGDDFGVPLPTDDRALRVVDGHPRARAPHVGRR